MVFIDVEGDEPIARRLERFRHGTLLTEVADTVRPGLVTALRLAAPRDTGKLADHIWARRETSLGVNAKVDLIATTDVPYAKFVLYGTKAHQIVPRLKGVLRWYDQMGDAVFATVVNHPGTKPNRFPRKVWVGMREPILNELMAQVRRQLEGL